MTTSPRDRAWLEGLYRTHRSAVWAYAARRIRADEADDIVSEVFVTAWRSRDSVPAEPADPLPWLYRTASNHVLHARRGEARRGRLAARAGETEIAEGRGTPMRADAGAGPNGLGVDAVVIDRLDAHQRVRSMLAALPADDAEILRLSTWEGLESPALGEVLGCSAAAARVRLHRARRRAQRILDRLDEQAATATGATQIRSVAEGARPTDSIRSIELTVVPETTTHAHGTTRSRAHTGAVPGEGTP